MDEKGSYAAPMEKIEREIYDKILKQKNYIIIEVVGFRGKDDCNQPSKKGKPRREIKKLSSQFKIKVGSCSNKKN